MIKTVENKEDIIRLWKEAFGDSEEDILFFLDNANYESLGCFENEKLVSMLFLIGSSLGEYIYAACTDKKMQGKGYMSELLNYCKDNYSSLCLIPASDSLEKYYFDRGFKSWCSIEELSFSESDEICEYLFEGYKLTEPKVLRYMR